jgi:hypothetical protein
MKFTSLTRYALLIAVVITALVSCNSDDYQTGVDEVSDTVKDGTWKVGYFFDSGVDKTQNYAGYNFTFGNYGVLTATKETLTYSGIWSVSPSTNDSDVNSTIFMIAFGSPDVLMQLGRNWKVVENTGTSLKLRDDSQGDAAINNLYFEKN